MERILCTFRFDLCNIYYVTSDNQSPLTCLQNTYDYIYYDLAIYDPGKRIVCEWTPQAGQRKTAYVADDCMITPQEFDTH